MGKEIYQSAVANLKTQNVISKELLELPASQVILAIGHSSRDTFENLLENNFLMKGNKNEIY